MTSTIFKNVLSGDGREIGHQLNIYFVISRQHRLGIAKLKYVFRSFLTHSKN